MFRKPRNLFIIILLISAALRLFNVDFADGKPVFDERGHYLRAARTYLSGKDDTVPQHPPLGKELIAAGILIFGDNPYGWRMPSLVFSLIGIGVVYQLAKEMFGSHSGVSLRAIESPGSFHDERSYRPASDAGLQDDHVVRRMSHVAPISALLLSVDSLYFIYSRLAVLDMFLTVFVLTTLLFLWRTYRDGGATNLMLLAVSFGLAMATKWTALQLAPVMLLFLFLRYRMTPRFLGMIATIMVIASAVYAISYAPYLMQHSLGELVELQRRTVTVWRNFDQDRVFTPETYFMRHATSWIMNPVSAYFSEQTQDGKLRLVIGLYNPVVLWGGLLWAMWGVRQWNRSRFTLSTLFLLLPILSNYLPWFFVRRVQYSYYFLPSLPLLVILVSSVLERARRVKRDWVAMFLLSAIIMFGYLFPFLTSVPANPRFLNPLASGPIRVRLFYDETPERVIFSP